MASDAGGDAALRRAEHAVGAEGAPSAAGRLHAAEDRRISSSPRRFLKAGADPNARLRKSLWYTTYNRDLLGVDRTGATPFWLAAYTLDMPAMRLLLKYGADPNIRTAKVPERYEEGGPDLTRSRSIGPAADSVERPGRGCRSTPRPASATASASPATRIVTCRTAGCRR